MEKSRFEDDSRLIRSCIEKDHAAWDFFTKKYSGLILSAIGHRLRKYGIYPGRDDLGEIRQNVLSLLWEGDKFSEIRDPSGMKYWLAVVSGNTAVEYMRKQKRANRLAPISLSEMVGDTALAEVIPSGGLTPSEELEKSDLSEKLNQAIESLPDKEKLVLKLNVLHGKKHEEIAEIIAMPQATVSSHIKRAKERLKKKLNNYA